MAKRKTVSKNKKIWSFLLLVFIAAVGVTFVVEGFLTQGANKLAAFVEYFIGIILLAASKGKKLN